MGKHKLISGDIQSSNTSYETTQTTTNFSVLHKVTIYVHFQNKVSLSVAEDIESEASATLIPGIKKAVSGQPDLSGLS
ncbi:hypothetical protein Hanom_Chr10g00882321 [Helianthus anomalus]